VYTCKATKQKYVKCQYFLSVNISFWLFILLFFFLFPPVFAKCWEQKHFNIHRQSPDRISSNFLQLKSSDFFFAILIWRFLCYTLCSNHMAYSSLFFGFRLKREFECSIFKSYSCSTCKFFWINSLITKHRNIIYPTRIHFTFTQPDIVFFMQLRYNNNDKCTRQVKDMTQMTEVLNTNLVPRVFPFGEKRPW
jgi:hypothetical protein